MQVYRLSASALTYFDPHTASASSKYLLIIFKGGNSLTLFGYDVERPNNTPDIIWSLLTIVFQLFLAAYVLGEHLMCPMCVREPSVPHRLPICRPLNCSAPLPGTLFHYLVAKDEALEIYQKKVRMMVDFAQERELPVHLKNRLLAYMEFTFNKSKEKYAANIELPKTLELRIAKCQYKEVIDTCMVPGACLRGCSEQFINALLRNLHEVRCGHTANVSQAESVAAQLSTCVD